uniref:Uncharacterized protein n=1 Tax=Podoviridae sp. ctxJ29 TaxID=2827754 RepID=A0A8S5S788_9CAUD|nr:MAG TPA: hypothetical protein [Podoviridae sp. ctxJ29]
MSAIHGLIRIFRLKNSYLSINSLYQNPHQNSTSLM